MLNFKYVLKITREKFLGKAEIFKAKNDDKDIEGEEEKDDDDDDNMNYNQ